MSSESDAMWDKRYDRFSAHPIRWIIGAVVVCIIIGIALIPVGWGFAWLNKGAEVAGPGNVSAQYSGVITDWNAMQQAAINACGAADSQQQSGDPTLLEDPAFAYKAQYRHIAVDYDARQNDIFKAKIVGPSGYPQNAPSLEEMQKQVC